LTQGDVIFVWANSFWIEQTQMFVQSITCDYIVGFFPSNMWRF